MRRPAAEHLNPGRVPCDSERLFEHAEVLVQDPVELVAVRPAHGRQLPGMDVEYAAVELSTSSVRVLNRSQLSKQSRHRMVKGPVPAGSCHGAVEHRIGSKNHRAIAQTAPQQLDRPAEVGVVGGGRGFRGDVRDRRLQDAASDQDVDHRVLFDLHEIADQFQWDQICHEEYSAT